MPSEANTVRCSDIECCPVVQKKPTCDVLDFRYQLPYRTVVGDNRTVVLVDVILHFRFERCPGDLALGDLIYTTTLLPKESVRLFTSDRHSRWSYDTESNLAYRHETTSEESFFTASVARSLSNLTIAESGSSFSSSSGSWSEGGGGGGVNLFGIIKIGGGGKAGKYNSQSVGGFARGMSQHAQSSSSAASFGVRARSSTAIGEVEHRQHAEGESESHLESASRTFSNPNRCHAITYFFYKINKTQHIKFRLVAIERRVNDPAAPTDVESRPTIDESGGVEVRPDIIPAANKERLQVERMARAAATERRQAAQGTTTGQFSPALFSSAQAFTPEPMSPEVARAALAEVDGELAKEGLIEGRSGRPTEKIIAELSWERTEVLPTPGIIVRGCLDKCNTCEPALQRQIELELDRMKLDNELLKKKTELLEKSQEYRCCPNGHEEPDDSE